MLKDTGTENLLAIFSVNVTNSYTDPHAYSPTIALWSGTNKNRDVSTGPLARTFARSLAPLTHLLAPDCSLCSRPPLRSLACLLAYFAHSLARGKVND